MAEQPKSNDTVKRPSIREVRRIESDELFRGGKLLVIHHAGEEYRLILTRNNRLILQK